MNYRAKRNQKRLSAYTVAKKLGISRQTYIEIEKGKREFEGELLEKWYEIMDNATEVKIERDMRIFEIREFFASGEANKKLKEFNYSKQELAKKINYDNMVIYRCFNNEKQVSDDVKEEIYDFLHNKLNIKIKNDKKETKKINKTDIEINTETTQPINEIKEATNNIIIESKLNINDKDEYIKKLERQIMLYEKLIMKL